MNKINTITILLVACLFLNCKDTEGEYHSLIEKIEAESKTFHDTIMSSEAYIGDIETIEITEGGHTFLIPERKGQITSYACIECHSKPLAEMQDATLGPKAHWDIEVVHANEDAMNCATCHNLDDMNHLKSLTGREIDFNRSYKLCSQCHTSQFEDWKGGAHGKNIGGWTKPRAAMTCVNCHNPHRPQIESKWPERYNTQKARERE